MQHTLRTWTRCLSSHYVSTSDVSFDVKQVTRPPCYFPAIMQHNEILLVSHRVILVRTKGLFCPCSISPTWHCCGGWGAEAEIMCVLGVPWLADNAARYVLLFYAEEATALPSEGTLINAPLEPKLTCFGLLYAHLLTASRISTVSSRPHLECSVWWTHLY